MTQKHTAQYLDKANELRAVAVFVTHWRSREELTRLAEVYEHLAALAETQANGLAADASASQPASEHDL